MRLKSFLINNRIRIIQIITCIIFIIGFLAFQKKLDDTKKEIKSYSLNKDCMINVNGKNMYSGDSKNYNFNDIKRGDKIYFDVILPDVKIINPIIIFENQNDCFNIYLDNDLIGSYGEFSKKAKIYGYNNFKQRLPDGFQKRKLRIEIIVGDESIKSRMAEFTLINASDADRSFWIDNSVNAALALFMLIAGTISLMFSLYSFGFKDVYRKIIWLSLMAIFAGVWILNCFNIIEYWVSSAVIMYYAEYETLFLSLLFTEMLAYEFSSIVKIKKINMSLVVVLAIYIVATNILTVTKLLYWGNMVIVFQMLAMLSIGIIAIGYIYESKKKMYNLKAITIGSVMTMVATIVYCIGYATHFSSLNISLSILPIIELIFLAMNFVGIIEEISRKYILNIEKGKLLDMVYTDELTQIHNRRAYEEYLESIGDSNITKYAFFSIDLNNLKETNDTYGHAQGDKLIRAFANALSKIEDVSFIARIGGDEFFTSIENPRKDIQVHFTGELKSILAQDEVAIGLNLGFGCGCSVYNKDESESIQDCLFMADENMYIDKENSKLQN